MSKVAIITDLHFGARGDATTFVDYMDKFYTDTFFPTCKERNIDTVLNPVSYTHLRAHET